jgi:hypothetical protein
MRPDERIGDRETGFLSAALGGARFCAERGNENDENVDKKIRPAMFLAGHRGSVLHPPCPGFCGYEEG